MSDIVITMNAILSSLKTHQRSLSGDELMVMDSATERQVRTAISILRRRGYLIVGTWSNYHIAKSYGEVEQVALELEHQAMMLQEIARAMRSAARSEPSLYR